MHVANPQRPGEPELHVVPGARSFRTVEVVRRAEHDRWDIVEAIQQDIDDAGEESTARAVDSKDGPKGAEFAAAIRVAGAEPLQAKTVAGLSARALSPASLTARAVRGSTAHKGRGVLVPNREEHHR